jgi:hypothetical protein
LCFSCNGSSNKPASSNADSTIEQTKDSIAIPFEDGSKGADQQAMRIADLLRTQLVKNDLKALTDDDRRFSYSEVDLNDDNEQELFVAMRGRYFCGNAGCTVFLLNSKGEKINGFTIVNGPIAVTPDKTNGWHNLVIPSSGRFYLVKYNGKSYPGNPSVQPEFKGEILPAYPTVLANSATVYQF